MPFAYSPPLWTRCEPAVALVRRRCLTRRCAACADQRVCPLSIDDPGFAAADRRNDEVGDNDCGAANSLETSDF